MKNWKSILLLALVFFAGVFAGVVGTRAVVRRVVQQAIAHPEKMQALLERNLTRKLRLDASQQLQVHDILTEARGQLRGLRQEFQPQAAAVLRGTDEKISALLTPEQQARYEKLKAEERPLLRALRPEPRE
jgi:Spy/CpxP family protein refolding chaperone